ncbi:MAG: hypothetical protein ACP5N1_01905 [Candidatus Woesearchaeota archaeon]
MVQYKLLTPGSRKELIETICDHLHEGGIKALKTYGDYSKTTGLYHFTIKEPEYMPNEPFIFVTELFGNEEAIPSSKTGHYGFSRLQYHGNFDGLQRVVQQLITPGLSLPAFITLADKKSNNITDSQRERFDNALEYLAETVRYHVPAIRIYVADTELFSHTYYID